MKESNFSRKIYITAASRDWKGKKQQAFNNVKEKDVIVAERKAHITEVIQSLILSENLQDPAKQLTIKLLQNWMNNNPDKFFGLNNVQSMLKTYFFGEINILKFSLGLIKEE